MKQCTYGQNGGHACGDVRFISRYHDVTDYCVDGERIGIKDGQPLPRRIFLYQLDEYAKYLQWRSQPENRYLSDNGTRAPQPFEYTLETKAA